MTVKENRTKKRIELSKAVTNPPQKEIWSEREREKSMKYEVDIDTIWHRYIGRASTVAYIPLFLFRCTLFSLCVDWLFDELIFISV